MPGDSRRQSRASHGLDLIEVVVRPKKYYRISHQGQADSTRDKIVVEPHETRRIIKNVAVISLAMMTQYVAYQGTLNLQSSLNAEDGLGTIALSCMYLAMGASCLVLPTLMIRRLTCKWTLVIGMSCFLPYIALQLFSRFYTLVPAGILLGIGAAPMWAAQATYLTQIGQIYAILKGAEIDAIITLFFGVFFFAWQNGDSMGNLLSSVVLDEKKANDSSGNGTEMEKCGRNFCSENGGGISKPEPHGVFILIMIYIPCIIVAVLIIVIFLDPLKRYGEGRKGAHSSESSTKRLVSATFHQMRRTNQQLLIPLTVFIGLEQAWIAAEYTQAYVACVLGVHMVGYVMVSWGVVDSIGCFTFGFGMEYVGRTIIIFIGATVNICLIGFKLFWRPVAEAPAVFYAMAGIWGIGDAVWATQINGFYGLLFRRNKEAAFSNYRLFESLGFFMGFSYSSLLCVREKLYILLLVLTLGLIGYLAVEVLYQNKQGNYRNQEKYEQLARELAAERGRLSEVENARRLANIATQRIKDTVEASDGEDDELEDDITVQEKVKKNRNM